MKLKFKTQAYQTAAVQAVADCFKKQVPHHGGIRYRLDPGSRKATPENPQAALALKAASPETAAEKEAAFRNADFWTVWSENGLDKGRRLAANPPE